MFGLVRSLLSCAGCGSRVPEESGLCRSCQAGLHEAVHQPGLLALGRYDGRLASAVRALKFGGVTRLARPLGLELARQVRQRGWRPSAVTAVPLHRSRERQRGYNQAQLLAQVCAEQLGIPCLPLLGRPARTSQQARLRSHRRPANTRHAFRLHPNAPRVLPARVLLVDDVLTTGATLESCRQVLMRSGCHRVYVAVVAAAGPKPATEAARQELAAVAGRLTGQT